MSKLTKLINEPELFILDAIKKRKILIDSELNKLNKIFNKVGLNKSFNIDDIEKNIVYVGLLSYQKISLKKYLLRGLEFQRNIEAQGTIQGVVSQIKHVTWDFKSLYKAVSDKSSDAETYISPQVVDILKVLKDKR